MTLGKPVRVWKSMRFDAWFWSPAAAEIMVAAGGRFQKVQLAANSETTSAEK
jgi:hypothetical protein